MRDAISRQAVLEMAYDMSEIDGEHFTEPCMVVDVEDIQKLPSVNPQEPIEVLEEIRQEIEQIKATKLYSTIDLKDMVLAIIDKHMEEHHD